MAESELEFEWDEAKARSNLEKHGVSFFTAVATFRNERLEAIDDRENYDEVRWIALGRAGTEVYRVIYTWRAENLVRIISAQRASKDEEEAYYREIYPQ
ncbi:MAG: BrnT family toxin [Terracidiphilus sp.]